MKENNAKVFLCVALVCIGFVFYKLYEISSLAILMYAGKECLITGKTIHCEYAIINELISFLFVVYGAALCIHCYKKCIQNNK